MSLLQIKNLSATVGGKAILNGLNLTIGAGEVHAIMGPNGAGKSTLAHVLAGRPDYEVTGGSVLFDGKELLEMEPEERAREGLFLAFQYPVEIPGVANATFLRTALNTARAHRGETELDAMEFLDLMRDEMKKLGIDGAFLSRALNEGYSGGEKKRNEVLQMSVLQPKMAILDETDSGLDIDALKAVAEGVERLKNGKRGFLVITHYQRLLDHLVPDFVHVLADGKIVRSGGKELAIELEEKGYGWIGEGAAETAGA